MLQRYKEIFYGLLFGVGASLIDVSMHASMEHQGYWAALVRPDVAMVAYRVAFLAFGLALGWLLWRKNRAERDFRHLVETLERIQRGVRQPALLIHAKMQMLLTRTDLHLPPDAEEMLRHAYEKSREIGYLAEEKFATKAS
ncbi:MAG TPA: hypothetical protein VJ731_04095 [Terriglobales bacterium]|nr:hypothetical protein [Terriglobales bacterium]